MNAEINKYGTIYYSYIYIKIIYSKINGKFYIIRKQVIQMATFIVKVQNIINYGVVLGVLHPTLELTAKLILIHLHYHLGLHISLSIGQMHLSLCQLNAYSKSIFKSLLLHNDQKIVLDLRLLMLMRHRV